MSFVIWIMWLSYHKDIDLNSLFLVHWINDYFSDSLFTNNFNFIKKSIHNKHLYHIFNTIKVDIKQYGKDILNQFYSEFCIWDRNNDGKLGIVLTPDDIVDLMVNESFKCYCEVNNELNSSNIKLIDFCTGTGSFLIKGSKFTKSLYGCECGDERYSLAKCNFILHDLDYHNLKYNSCLKLLVALTLLLKLLLGTIQHPIPPTFNSSNWYIINLCSLV